MKHLDLFSGIGGFALAAQWAGLETVAFCEKDPFCQKVLKKHWPDVPIYDDIKEFNGTEYEEIDLLTGGFPCQPFSRAGKQQGESDSRSLWPEMLRVIKQTRPTWVICENVVDFEYMGLDQLCTDLESQGYATRPFIIPAGAVQRDHARERLWVVAYAECKRTELEEHTDRRQIRELPKNTQFAMVRCSDKPTGAEGHRASNVLLDGDTFQYAGQIKPLFLGSTHGIPNRLDRRRSLGNAIVPQIAYALIHAILVSNA